MKHGTSEKNSTKAVAEALYQLLADTYTLALKTQNYHWNVTGPAFYSLHGMFEAQYGELAVAIDEIAERIRALGQPVPATLAGFAQAATVRESAEIPDAAGMLTQLAKAHGKAADSARKAVAAASETDDVASADLGTRRLDAHDKAAWMLKSSA